MTKDQLHQYIQKIVLQEVQQAVPFMVRDVMSKMLMESVVSQPTTPPQGNSHKRQAIQEAPQRRYRGDTEVEAPRRVAPPQLLVTEAMSEHGIPMPIDVDSMPDYLVRALTRTDYGDVVKAAQERQNG